MNLSNKGAEIVQIKMLIVETVMKIITSVRAMQPSSLDLRQLVMNV